MLVAPACKAPLLFLSVYGDGCDDEDVGDNDEDAGDDDDGGRIASLKLHRSACLVSYRVVFLTGPPPPHQNEQNRSPQ